MDRLTVRWPRPHSLQFGPPWGAKSHGRAGPGDVQAWSQVMRQFLDWAFAGRPVYLIGGGSPMVEDLIEKGPSVLTGGQPHVAFVPDCTESLIGEILDAGDLEAHLLVIACIQPPSAARLASFLRELEQSARDETPWGSEEAVFSLCDGDVIQWLNPHRWRAEIVGRLRAIATGVGWELDECGGGG